MQLINFGYEKQIHLFSPNARPRTLTSKIPGNSMTQFCQVALNGDEFAVIGGFETIKGGSWNGWNTRRFSVNNTRIINIKTDKLREGAQLNIPRHNHACGEIEIAGKSYIVATGGQIRIDGSNKDDYVNSTELLDKNCTGNDCWLTSKNTLLNIFSLYLISTFQVMLLTCLLIWLPWSWLHPLTKRPFLLLVVTLMVKSAMAGVKLNKP